MEGLAPSETPGDLVKTINLFYVKSIYKPGGKRWRQTMKKIYAHTLCWKSF